MRWRLVPFLAGALVGALAACSSCGGNDGPTYRVPEETGDGWTTASVEDVGMRAAPLESLLQTLSDTDDHLIHGVLVVKDQRLVFEHYWDGVDLEVGTLEPVERSFDRDTLHYAASVSKSVTSILTGVAVDLHLLESVDVPLFSLFPDYGDLQNEENAGITLEHLLAFSSGLEWNEFEYGFDDPRDSHNLMFRAEDPIGHLLGRAVVFPPGSEFLYNSGDTNLVGEAVRRASSSNSLADFAEAHLFGPLGIHAFTWYTFPLAPEVTFASGGLSLRPRDMAKLGALYLAAGSWQGEPIVSPSWVHASTQMETNVTGSERTFGYGYNWWLARFQDPDGPVDSYYALGWGGQYVFVFPDLDMVLVLTAGRYWEEQPPTIADLIEDYILPATEAH